ncbi:DNA double-strand break repair nuclease NurA [Candidatus Dependentiae bacterium]
MIDWNSLLGEITSKSKEKIQLSRSMADPEYSCSIFSVPKGCKKYSVLAVDGSQIYPDRHMPGGGCALINIGGIALNYGTASNAKLFSVPEFIPNADGRVTPEIVDLMREERELRFAFEKCELIKHSDSLVLIDGSLSFSHLAGKNDKVRRYFLRRYIECLESFYTHKILVAAYMSSPRTRDLCCKRQGFVDVDIVQNLLTKKAIRTEMFGVKNDVMSQFPEHLKTCFCYLNVGFEIVRIEFPEWVADSKELVDQVCAICLDQAEKGRGYPVSLAEAHFQAVVRASDKKLFYRLLRQKGEAGDSFISHKMSKKLSLGV